MSTPPDDGVPDGYFAILDPADPAVMTYWRVTAGRVTPWPRKAWWGPARPLKRDAPAGMEERIAWMRSWQTAYRAWAATVHQLLAADPGPARRRFAELTTRCCDCGRVLHDETSKTLGIGPDCRDGISPAALAALFAPAVSAAHAAQADTPVTRTESSR
ncbi:DUF6011 domain-containing protein [Streptomyces sp. CAU 1734]|uniref:DUF6011 domain-containing protein n=1 Tax=Streptomyces sp. CAU 1734 TaxID=3140360 RepID=UPI0032605303